MTMIALVDIWTSLPGDDTVVVIKKGSRVTIERYIDHISLIEVEYELKTYRLSLESLRFLEEIDTRRC